MTPAFSNQDLAEAMRLHQAGQFAQAERIYRQVVDREPTNAAVWQLLGMIALAERRFPAAVELIERAIQLDGAQPSYFANLGEAYRHLGQTAQAERAYRAGLSIQSGFARLHAMLGGILAQQGQLDEASASLEEALRLDDEDHLARLELGRVRRGQNRLAEGETCFRRVLALFPADAELHYDLASVLHGQGRLAEAAESYRAALTLDPAHTFAHNNLGVIHKEQGQLDEAEQHYRAILNLEPRNTVALLNMAVLEHSREDFEAAATLYRACLETDPRSVPALSGLGNVYRRQGHLALARQLLEQAQSLDPTSARTAVALARVLESQNLYGEAIASYQEAIRLDPRMAEAYNDLGKTQSDYGRRDEAIANIQRAIEIDPQLAPGYANLGVVLQSMGRLDEAIAAYRQAVKLDPKAVLPHGNLIYAMNHHPAVDAQALFLEHREWGRRHADPLTAQSAPHANDCSTSRRLRIGYVSAHFMEHAVNFFSEPILASHDHARFEVFCYSNAVDEDETTARLRGYVDHWRKCIGWNDEQLSQRIRDDQIDILIDLSGHIGGNRLLVFARKPAPVQVTYIGYQNTTGMAAMDYRLTDAFSDPVGETDRYYTEQLVRLPQTFFCYRPSPDAPPVVPLPSTAAQHITFGSINNFSKVTPEVLAVWAQIVSQTPGSRMIILADVSQPLVEKVSRVFAAAGVALDRIELAHRRSRQDYLALIQRLDIVLAPFPFNGHTTTCDALWQGVPVISLAGDSYVSRYGSSALVTLGLDECITTTTAGYIEAALRMAREPERLAELRTTLRQRMAASPLLDFAGFTRNLEAEYLRMWDKWCATRR